MNVPSRLSNVLFTLLGAASVGLVVALLAVAGVFDDDDGDRPGAALPSASARPTTTTSGAQPTSVSEIYADTAPGVAFIQARGGQGSLPFEGDGGGQAASGSGFLIDAKGHVVTNQHVVDGANRFTVRFGEKGDPLPAKLLGDDPSTDLAVLAVDPKRVPAETKPLELASSGQLRPGDAAIAIGSPFGLSGTVTTGIISALDREIRSPNGFPIAGVLQTDAAINPGNSGGPLLDAQGGVIGVNSQIASDSRQSSGVGFAVPVDTVKEVVPQLLKDGDIDRAYLGVSSGEQSGQVGAIVGEVAAGGPAAAAGLRVGDRITALAGRTVRSPSELSSAVLDHKPGERVKLAIVRDGERRSLEVVLGKRPDEMQQG